MYIQPLGVNQAVDRVMMDGRCTMAKIGTVTCEAVTWRLQVDMSADRDMHQSVPDAGV
jgi:hypothetical protein